MSLVERFLFFFLFFCMLCPYLEGSLIVEVSLYYIRCNAVFVMYVQLMNVYATV